TNLSSANSSYIYFSGKNLGMFPGHSIVIKKSKSISGTNPTISVKYRLNSGIHGKKVLSIPGLTMAKVETIDNSFLYSITDPEIAK
ncbi:MAG: hypothetical protein WBW94_04465, partial [Anaerolineales bacterium]